MPLRIKRRAAFSPPPPLCSSAATYRRRVTTEPNPALADLIARPEDRLLARLGATLLDEGRGFGAEDFDRRRRFATQWMSDRLEQISATVCGDPGVRALLD